MKPCSLKKGSAYSSGGNCFKLFRHSAGDCGLLYLLEGVTRFTDLNNFALSGFVQVVVFSSAWSSL
jgi:hypothetical protein